MFIPFKQDDLDKDRFYRTPKAFVDDEYYRVNMDSNMKLIYSILWDRYQLSIKNNWKDRYGNIYCIYTRDNLAHDLNVSVGTVTRCIKRLTELNLMKEIRRGLNKPNLMYIGQVNSGVAKYAIQESSKLRKSELDLSETEKIKRYIITSNDGYVFDYYIHKYKELFKRDHPTVKPYQVEQMKHAAMDIENEFNVDVDKWIDMIDEHFDKLPQSNNGNILYFLSGDSTQGVLRRYAE